MVITIQNGADLLSIPGKKILERFNKRFSIEEMFKDLKEVGGLGKQQVCNHENNIRCFRMLTMNYALVELWVGELWVGELWVGRLWVGRLWVGRLWVGRLWVGELWVGELWVGEKDASYLKRYYTPWDDFDRRPYTEINV